MRAARFKWRARKEPQVQGNILFRCTKKKERKKKKGTHGDIRSARHAIYAPSGFHIARYVPNLFSLFFEIEESLAGAEAAAKQRYAWFIARERTFLALCTAVKMYAASFEGFFSLSLWSFELFHIICGIDLWRW